MKKKKKNETEGFSDETGTSRENSVVDEVKIV